jgi:hypothetical protein
MKMPFNKCGGMRSQVDFMLVEVRLNHSTFGGVITGTKMQKHD